MKRFLSQLLLWGVLTTSFASCQAEYYYIEGIPTSDTNTTTIPAEGGTFFLQLVQYKWDETMYNENATRTQPPAVHQCYRYRLNIDDNIGEESEDYNGEYAFVNIPQNSTGQIRNLVIEVKIAEGYHHSEFVGISCNNPANKFGEWQVAWEGIQEFQ